MRHLLGIYNEGGGGKYLGLPEQFDKKKSELFRYIVEKVKEKTQGWSKKFIPGRKGGSSQGSGACDAGLFNECLQANQRDL